MLKIGNMYIPFHTITQIVVEGFQAYIWTDGDKYRFIINTQDDMDRLRAWIAKNEILELPEAQELF